MKGKSVVLAEKPSVGRDLAKVLKCRKKKRGFIEGNRYIVTWSLGHLVTLAEPKDYNKKFRHWNLNHLPLMPKKMKLKPIKKTYKQFKTVKYLLNRKDVSELIIATDAGREGELVARWIIVLSGWKRKIKRLWISSQTDKAIKQGFDNLKDGRDFDNLYQAAQARAEADWLIGLNITRALTCKYDAQLSAGRVQTPTLALIVDREKKIREFRPTKFWTIEADFDEFSAKWKDQNNNERFYDKKNALELKNKLENNHAVVADLTSKNKRENPPLAYDLTELQRDANNKYGFSAKKTLSLTQKLYERHKLLTYPRTDSRYLTTDMKNTISERMNALKIGNYKKIVQSIENNGIKFNKRIINDKKVSDHHAIIPTENTMSKNRLTNDEFKIYDLVAKRFLALFMNPFEYKQLDLVLDIAGQSFHTRTKSVTKSGWKKIYGKTKLGSNLNNFELKVGDKVKVKKIKVKMGETKPPARYTEATLLSAMENPGRFIDNEQLKKSIKEGGLGTPATRADIIEKLVKNFYIERKGKSFFATNKGIELLKLVPDQLKEPELTAKWEKILENIAAGRANKNDFIQDIKNSAKNLVSSLKNSKIKFNNPDLSDKICPQCGSRMYKRKNRNKIYYICSDKRCRYDSRKPSRRGNKGRSRWMINKYSDNMKAKNTGDTLGDLLEQAMNKKKR